MAAEYMRYRVARSGISHVVVDSAGTLDLAGVPASPEAVQVLREAGMDLSGHRSKGLEGSDLRTADLVIAMSYDHLEEIEHGFPEGSFRAYLLRAFEKGPDPVDGAPELDDPMGKDLPIYRRQFELIRTCVDNLVHYLKHRTL